MAAATHTERLFEELDYREADGIEVSLLWNRSDNSVTVLVVDTRTGESFECEATPQTALDVFHHPFAHVAFRGPAREGRRATRDESIVA